MFPFDHQRPATYATAKTEATSATATTAATAGCFLLVCALTMDRTDADRGDTQCDRWPLTTLNTVVTQGPVTIVSSLEPPHY